MNLVFLFGDQLGLNIASLKGFDKTRDVIFMCEVEGEARAVKHHKKKLVFILSAMRHFAQELREAGYKLRYVRLDDPDNTQSFNSELARAIAELKPENIILTEPSEHRVRVAVQGWEAAHSVPVDIRPDDRFLCSREEFAEWAKGRKQLRMEYFYRVLRRKYNILMDGDQPVGGAWNYDKDNRKPPKKGLNIPKPFMDEHDDITRDLMADIAVRFPDHFGDIEPFHFAVTREGALAVLAHFIKERLQLFGTYQDAMLMNEPWMYHSHISHYINCGLLEPMECIRAAEEAYDNEAAPLNAVEGFIRQILGWREYVKGIYDLFMPEYRTRNYLNAERAIPPLYWGAMTKMNCMSQCVKETKENAYAHHIQRLMVLGNFALLAGLRPDEVNDWYHLVYADAYEWVELPNVSGMVLHADGGVLGSKPYAASGSYINKMSNYCGSCSYKPAKKNGAEACPFNYLYWNFMIEHAEALSGNPRMGMTYRTLGKMDDEKVAAVKSDAARFLKAMEAGETV